MFVRSDTFKTAFFAVAVHMPPEQFMFWVGFAEMVTAPYAGTVAKLTASSVALATSACLFMMFLLGLTAIYTLNV
jgi:hypothetical protein